MFVRGQRFVRAVHVRLEKGDVIVKSGEVAAVSDVLGIGRDDPLLQGGCGLDGRQSLGGIAQDDVPPKPQAAA